MTRGVSMQFLNKYIKKYWKLFCAAVSCLMVEALCDLMQPTIMSKIVDTGVANKEMDYVLKMGGVMLLVTAVGAAGAIGRNILATNVSQRFGADLRSDLYRKIQNFSFDNIDKFEGASLVTRLTNDVTQVQNFANGLMRIFVKAPLVGIGSVFMAVRLNPGMSLVLIAVIPVIVILISASMRIGYPFFSRVQKSLDGVNGVMREYLSGVRVVKAFNRFDYEVERFGKANEALASVSIKAMRVMASFTPGISLSVNLAIVAILWLGGIRVNAGHMHVGQIIAFINYMTQILFSLMMISNIFMTFVRAKASAERLGEVFEEENTMKISEKPVQALKENGRVDFEHVYFSYAGTSGDPVLKDVTFTCNPGETVGIIGSTGSGKSSLLNLIPRFYDATSGKVKVGGIDVKAMDPKSLREKMAVVPQRAMLFTGTILDNIKWGKDSASETDVKEAAAAAQAHDFITSFPEAYETLLGQGGVNLSGGQKQRISIARALVRKPEILILDDSTSAVDVTTESKIREALREYSRNLTCLIVAQRITSVMGADKIVVLDNGKISGIGTHEELMQNCEIYQDIFRSQIGKEMM